MSIDQAMGVVRALEVKIERIESSNPSFKLSKGLKQYLKRNPEWHRSIHSVFKTGIPESTFNRQATVLADALERNKIPEFEAQIIRRNPQIAVTHEPTQTTSEEGWIHFEKPEKNFH